MTPDNPRDVRWLTRRIAKGRDTYRYVPSAEAPRSRGFPRRPLIPARPASRSVQARFDHRSWLIGFGTGLMAGVLAFAWAFILWGSK